MDNKDGTWGMLWVRDKPKETLLETIENGIKYFEDKYKILPTHIECSKKDTEELFFMFNNIKVVAQKYYSSGTIWIRLNVDKT